MRARQQQFLQTFFPKQFFVLVLGLSHAVGEEHEAVAGAQWDRLRRISLVWKDSEHRTAVAKTQAESVTNQHRRVMAGVGVSKRLSLRIEVRVEATDKSIGNDVLADDTVNTGAQLMRSNRRCRD